MFLELPWEYSDLGGSVGGKLKRTIASCGKAASVEARRRPSRPCARSAQRLGRNPRKTCLDSPAAGRLAPIQENSPRIRFRKKFERIKRL